MNKAVITLASILLAVALYNTATPSTSSSSSNQIFEQWLSTQNKIYPTPEEKNYRLRIFTSNLRKITSSNSKNTSFKLSLNKFSDLTSSEFRAKYLGLASISSYISLIKKGKKQNIKADPPREVDWVKAGAVSAIKNQGQCGSCWAFSAVGAIEGAHQIQFKKLTTYSEQQLVDCSGSFGNEGCNGGLMDNAFRYVIKNGLTTEDIYPYTGVDGKCHYDKSKAHVSLTSFTDVKQDEAELQKAVAQQPTSVAIYAIPIMQYSSGIYNDYSRCPSSESLLDHGVLAVGYGTENGQDYWVVKNSWGADWGEKGYIRFARKHTGTGICGIALAASWPSIY